MNAIAKNTTRRQTSRGRMDDGTANPIDRHVGARIRLRRTLMGMSQEKLGEALGLTFQQVQKYERGANRVGASRLFDLSRVLDVPVSFFFDDMSEAVEAASPAAVVNGTAGRPADPLDNPLARRDVLQLARDYAALDEGQATAVRALVAALAKSSV